MSSYIVNFYKFLALVLISLSVMPGANVLANGRQNYEIQDAETVAPNSELRTDAGFGKFPLIFEKNVGQIDHDAKFVARAGGYQLFLTDTGASFALKNADGNSSDTLAMNFAGANRSAKIEGAYEAETKTNYYTGKKRFENISNFQRVFYRNIYKGIDAFFYGTGENNKELEYDFIVEPNADPSQIKLKFDGAECISVTADGELLIKTANAELTQKKPYAYQDIHDERIEISSAYKVDGNTVTFQLGEYDSSKTLVIDPLISYLTYIGGVDLDVVNDIQGDRAGNSYITGETSSIDFHGEIRNTDANVDVFAAKINADGTAFSYVTILEAAGNDSARSIAIDSSGNAYVTGEATSGFPTTSGAFDRTLDGGIDGFVTKLNTGGGLVYSTLIGGASNTDRPEGIVVSSTGRAYIGGTTFSGTSFPTKNPFRTCDTASRADAFVTVLNNTGTGLVYSSCIGVQGKADFGEAIGIDASGNVFLTGSTESEEFPLKGALQTELRGIKDVFVAKFNPAATGEASLLFSTFLGGNGSETPRALAVDGSGRPYVAGETRTEDFPLQNPIQELAGDSDVFVSVLSANGQTLVQSTFLGGSEVEFLSDIDVTPSGTIYVVGQTHSLDFPLALPFQSTRSGTTDVFITKFKFGVGVMSSTLLGGNSSEFAGGVDVQGVHIFVGGDTGSTDLPTTPGTIKPVGDTPTIDGYVAKILDTQVDSVGTFRTTNAFTLTQSTSNVIPQTVTFSAALAGDRGVSGDWNGDDIDTIGSFSNGVWKTRESNFPITFVTPKTINYGQAGDIPVVGDWNGDGVDTPGLFRPSQGKFFLTNSNSNTPTTEVVISFGLNGDLPVAGDWNGDGIDSVGVFRPADGTFFLADQNIPIPPIAQVAFFGTVGDLPIAGDWDANGFDTVGVWRPSTQQFFLSNDNVNIAQVFTFGSANSQPIVGDWDGKP